MSSPPAPAPHPARWPVLMLACAGLFGQFYAFDVPAVLSEDLLRVFTAPGSGMDPAEFHYTFGLLYSVYSIPNMALPLAMGMLIDRWGFHSLIVALGLSVLVGQLTFVAGLAASPPSRVTMLVGRSLFGLGGESLQVAQSCMIFRWFRGHELAFALGLNLSVARCGSMLNDLVSPGAARAFGVVGAFHVGSVLCALGVLANIASVVLDRRAGAQAGLSESADDGEAARLSDLAAMPRVAWLLVLLCVCLYSAVLPFNNISTAFFTETRFAALPLAEGQAKAAQLASLLFLSSALGTPIFGLLVDRFGARRRLLLLSSGLLIAAYSTIFWAPAVLTMATLGMVYMIFAGALWPSFALTVPPRALGTVYGLTAALQNAGLAVVPMCIGHLQATGVRGDFRPVVSLLWWVSALSVGVGLAINLERSHIARVLDLPSAEAESCRKEREDAPIHCGRQSSVPPDVVPPGQMHLGWQKVPAHGS